VLPLGGDLDVDAEHAGQDGGGELGGELEQRGRSGLGGADTEQAKAFAESVSADGSARLSARKEPA